MKDLRDIGLALVLATLLCLGLTLGGCGPGSAQGGVGGQGTVFEITQNAPAMPQVVGPVGDRVPLASLVSKATEATAGAAANILIINYTVVDGGTFTDPSVGWGGSAAGPTAKPAPTSQPSTPVK